jgi:hypothetical protein
LKPGQDVVAQLELGDQLVRSSRIPIVNPPGFFIRLVESNMSVPASFETSAKRQAREDSERKERERRIEEDARQQLEWEHDDYCSQETSRFIGQNQATFEAIKDAKRTENRERHQAFSDEMIESIAQNEAKREIRKQVPLLTFEEFVDRKQHDPNFFLKPVGLSPAAEPEIMPTELPIDRPVMTDDVVVPQETAVPPEPLIIPLDPPVMAEERGEAIQPAPEGATQPAISEPAIELVADPPREEQSGNAAEQGMV